MCLSLRALKIDVDIACCVNYKPTYYKKKLQSISKLVVLTCFGIALMMQTSNSRAQILDTLRVTDQFLDMPLASVLKQIEQQYHVPFYFKEQWIIDKRVTATANNELLVGILSVMLDNHGLSFAVYGGNSVIIAPTDILSREFSQEYFIQKESQENFIQREGWPPNTQVINLGANDTNESDGELSIEATIRDGLEGDLLVGAVVVVKDLDVAVSSNSSGRFELQVPPGLHLVEISMLGYETKTVGLNLLSSSSWNIELLPEATELDEVLVSATSDDSNVRSTIVGMTKLSAVDIRDMPVFLGEPDVIKSLLTLPGVSTVGEGAGGFNVRGGNIDQNLIMQDDALVFNSSHAMGFFSIFNPDVIRDVTLYKGHIPAQYGGRVSSVLDVSLKGNNYEKMKVNGGVGLLASRIALETPIIKDKTSFLFGGRIAYSDWILNFVENPDVKESSLSFYDINAKITHRLGEKGTLGLSFYNSKDRFTYANDFGFSWRTFNTTLSWNQVIRPELISEFSISSSMLRNANFQPSGVDAFILRNGMNNFKIKEDLLISSVSNHMINAGFEINSYFPDDETLDPYSNASTTIPYQGARDRGIESALFVNDAINLTDQLSLSVGLRYSYYSQIGPASVNIYRDGVPTSEEDIVDVVEYGDGENVISYQGLDPRLSLVYQLNANSSVKVSYNQIHQFIHLISNTTSALPIDYWQVSNTYLKPLKAKNFSIGYFKNFNMNLWETSAEVYYRDLDNVVEYKDFPSLFLSDHLETELISGNGRSYGIELFVKKKSGRFNGWLSYAYARSLVQIVDEQRDEMVNNGEWFPSRLDQPHNINLVGNFNINKTNQLSFNFTFSTGRPLTGPNSNYSLDGYIIPNYSDRNEFRIPDYHRLDVSYTIQRGIFRTSRYNDSFTFSIYNLYARENAYSIYFVRDNQSIIGAYKLSILGTMLPSITYNFSF